MKSVAVLALPVLLLVVFFQGCPPSSSEAPPDLVATEVAVQRAAAATLTAEAPKAAESPGLSGGPDPTNTVGPATAPALPPTQTTTFQKWSSSQVVNAFQSAGLEAENARPMTRDDYGMAPMTAIEGTRFLIPSLGEDRGGRILSFASQQDLEQTQQYYVELGRSSALFFSWVFAKDNVLVQINGDLPEDKARQYEAALNAMQ